MNSINNFNRARGIALLTGMVLLLLMSLLALAAFKDALLETHISRNYSEMELLFQQTESAIRYAESRLLPNSTPDSMAETNVVPPHRIVPFDSLASSSDAESLFEPSTVSIVRLAVPGSKVRGNGPQNKNASPDYFRITAITRHRNSGQGTRIVSTVSRGTQ